MLPAVPTEPAEQDSRPPCSAIAAEARNSKKKSVRWFVALLSRKVVGFGPFRDQGIGRFSCPSSRNTGDKGPNCNSSLSGYLNHDDVIAFKLRKQCGGKEVEFRKWAQNIKKVKVGSSAFIGGVLQVEGALSLH